MFTTVTLFHREPLPSLYQVDNEESARHIGKTVAGYDHVSQTLVYQSNPQDDNGIGQMVLIATFGG